MTIFSPCEGRAGLLESSSSVSGLPTMRRRCFARRSNERRWRRELHRQQYALGIFHDHPTLNVEEQQAPILAGKVVVGMSLYAASLAAGRYSFAVQADRQVWPDIADPLQVIERQHCQPDDTKLTFTNATQFAGSQQRRFTV